MNKQIMIDVKAGGHLYIGRDENGLLTIATPVGYFAIPKIEENKLIDFALLPKDKLLSSNTL